MTWYGRVLVFGQGEVMVQLDKEEESSVMLWFGSTAL